MLCKDQLASTGTQTRSEVAVTADVDNMLSSKSLDELKTLESQVTRKVESNEPIDVEYWDNVLRRIAVFQAKAELHNVYKSIAASRLEELRQQQGIEAGTVKTKLDELLSTIDLPCGNYSPRNVDSVVYSLQIDPKPQLKLSPEDRALEVVEESEALAKLVSGDFAPFRPRLIFVGRH